MSVWLVVLTLLAWKIAWLCLSFTILLPRKLNPGIADQGKAYPPGKTEATVDKSFVAGFVCSFFFFPSVVDVFLVGF